MVVDAELGMPLDLSQYEGLWDYDANAEEDYDTNPDLENLPELDPKDAFLLADVSGAPSAEASTAAPSMNVSWLRKTEYISSSSSAGIPTATRDSRPVQEPIPDISHEAQITSIEASFREPLTPKDLAKLRHPTKKNLRAVDSFEVLPDSRIWFGSYDLVRFSERPGDRPLEEEDPRLETAVIRPVVDEHDETYLSYYLTPEDGPSIAYRASRQDAWAITSRRRANDNPLLTVEPTPEEVAAEMGERTAFNFVRDYEMAKIDGEVINEYVLSLNDGKSGEVGLDGTKGAFYKDIGRKYVVRKKKRAARGTEETTERWDIIHVTHEPLSDPLWHQREEATAEVNDPDYLAKAAAAAEADGEMEADDDGLAETTVQVRSTTAHGESWTEEMSALPSSSVDLRVNNSLDNIMV
ncbi:hypothetical protein DL93DRAFT_2079008 [Clavulina sp. PMI_390]|nr:hypothetical protein DL93DRAFT_2079008 [Clavulina sp. PMI_390]